jgi:hypothetical protein
MKQVSIAIIVIGIFITAFAGFQFVTQEKVVEIGALEITKEKKHVVPWSPLVGVAMIVIGGGMYFFYTKKR